ncbi:MAG: ankyrin repeat domain-containing protein [Clostridiales bacterium]|jgi:hypothetical protein|nr:ankyrin repeat domain-containing protein [Clostridiales bacterium]
MNLKIKQDEKERRRALGEILTAECKAPGYSLDIIETALQNGADINYNNSRPLYFAAKTQKFELIKYLLSEGAGEPPFALTCISAMCDFKGFGEESEPRFFELLELLLPKTDEPIKLFTPYINAMAVDGRIDKLNALGVRFGISEGEIADAVYIRIIFEIILKNCDAMLEFIERHKNWMTQSAFDLCVSTGEWMVLEHIISRSELRTPGIDAVGQAVYEGYFEVLDILTGTGYDFLNKPLLLEKACRAAYSKGTRSLEYLLRRGYTLNDGYNGKSIAEHAVADSNTPLREFLQKRGIPLGRNYD